MGRAGSLLGVAALLLAGCSKTSKPTEPWPPAGSTLEVEPNDATPQNLGVLGAGDLLVAGTAASAGDVDLYAITLGATTNLHVEVSWSGSPDLDLGVMNSSGIMVNFQDTGADPEHCTLPALTPGIYMVRATAKSAKDTHYKLTIGPR